jgi:hypothetical protein
MVLLLSFIFAIILIFLTFQETLWTLSSNLFNSFLVLEVFFFLRKNAMSLSDLEGSSDLVLTYSCLLLSYHSSPCCSNAWSPPLPKASSHSFLHLSARTFLVSTGHSLQTLVFSTNVGLLANVLLQLSPNPNYSLHGVLHFITLNPISNHIFFNIWLPHGSMIHNGQSGQCFLC